MSDKVPEPARSHYPSGVAIAPVPGTLFSELHGRYPPGSAQDASLKLIRRILFLSLQWRTRVDEELKRVGQSHARWMTLVWLRILDGQANHREIAEAIGVELPTLIRLLNRLEAEALVIRAPAPEGGRAKTVLLTEAGSEVLDEINALTEAVQASFCSGLEAKDMDACSAFLDRMVRNAGGGETLPNRS